MPPDLTPTRRRLLQVTLQLASQATLGNVAHTLGITRQAVAQHAALLRDRGYLEAAEGRYAPLIPTERTRALLGDGGYPLVGEIAAGKPIYAEQDVQEYISRVDQLIDLREGDFFLRVRGESMIGVGIYPGDAVAVRPAGQVDSGSIAVVLLPGEGVATLKRLVYREGEEDVTLLSENPDYPPMTFRADEIRVQGCLVAHVGQASLRQRRS